MSHPTLPLPRLPRRSPDAHKGNFGRILIVAGSRGMSGAAVLCAGAALRGGAGLVRVAVPDVALPLVAVGNPCAMTVGLPHDNEGRLAAVAETPLLQLAEWSDVIVMGPGLGQGTAIQALVAAFVTRTTCPLVLDADALNGLQGQTQVLKGRTVPPILTPHPGEFGRISGAIVPQDDAGRQEAAVRFAREHEVIVLLKGRGTVVTDGTRVHVNSTGNPGMATAGSGDVLSGLIGALLGQHLTPFEAAQLGAYLHGLAGDHARDRVGEVSLIATDLIDALPRAFREFQGDGVDFSGDLR